MGNIVKRSLFGSSSGSGSSMGAISTGLGGEELCSKFGPAGARRPAATWRRQKTLRLRPPLAGAAAARADGQDFLSRARWRGTQKAGPRSARRGCDGSDLSGCFGGKRARGPPRVCLAKPPGGGARPAPHARGAPAAATTRARRTASRRLFTSPRHMPACDGREPPPSARIAPALLLHAVAAARTARRSRRYRRLSSMRAPRRC